MTLMSRTACGLALAAILFPATTRADEAGEGTILRHRFVPDRADVYRLEIEYEGTFSNADPNAALTLTSEGMTGGFDATIASRTIASKHAGDNELTLALSDIDSWILNDEKTGRIDPFKSVSTILASCDLRFRLDRRGRLGESDLAAIAAKMASLLVPGTSPKEKGSNGSPTPDTLDVAVFARGLVATVYPPLPEGPVREGTTWTSDVEGMQLPWKFLLPIDGKYRMTCKGREARTGHRRIGLHIEIPPGEFNASNVLDADIRAMIEETDMHVTWKSAKGSGLIRFDPEEGRLVSGRIELYYAVLSEMVTPMGELLSIVTDMRSATTIKLVDNGPEPGRTDDGKPSSQGDPS